MGNEFKIKKGFISEGDSKVNGVLSAQTINVTVTPSNDNSQTQVLVRNNTTGIVEYRDASSLSGTSGANTFVTGTTFGSNQSLTRRNDGADVLILTGGTNVTLSNPSTNQIKIDVNIPSGMNTFVTGFTYNDNNNTFTIFDNDSGVFPATINQVSGLTVSNYIDFAQVTPSAPTPIAGRTFYSEGDNALSYHPDTPAMDVTINIGQEGVIRIYNNTGIQINNGQACHINGSFSGTPTVNLTIASGVTVVTDVSFETSGVATHDIPDSTYGFITTYGLVRDLNITGVAEGSPIWASDTVPGGFVYSLPTTNSSRITQIGYVITTGATDAKIMVQIENEQSVGILSAKEFEVISLNLSSTGLREGGLISADSSTTFKISAGSGIVMDNTTSTTSPVLTEVAWPDITGNTLTSLTGDVATIIMLNSNNTIQQYPLVSPPSQSDKRDRILLGVVAHSDKTSITNIYNGPIEILSPVNQIEDLTSSIGTFSINGNFISGIAGTLELQKDVGDSFYYGGNYQTDKKNPSVLNTGVLSGSSTPSSPLVYATGTDVLGLSGYSINTDNYDPSGLGVITSLGVNKFTAHRIWHLPINNLLVFQYGQTEYISLGIAIEGFPSENFVEPPGLNLGAYLISVIVTQEGETDLTNATTTKFIQQGKFAGVGGGGGSIADTLQSAYGNSTSPEIVTDVTRGAVDYRIGTGTDSDNLVTFQQTSGVINSFITGEGNGSFKSISGTTLTLSNVPTLNPSATDILVRNSSTGLVDYRPVSGITPDLNTFVTGFTYNDANTFTISDNAGSEFIASINTVTGLTVNGVFSATTYTGITLNSLDDVTTGIPTTPDNTYQGRVMYFDVPSNSWLSTDSYSSTGTVTIWGKKGSAGTISKGLPVYIVGFDNDIHEVELANSSTGTTMPVIGFAGEDLDNTNVNPIITFGKIEGINTTATVTTLNPNGESWVINDELYMSKTTGGLTAVRPSGSDTQIQRIAKVLKVDVTSGQLFIFNTARTSGLPNLTTDYLWVGNGNDLPQEIIKTDVGVTTTGFTYNDANTFTISDNAGSAFTTTINQVSGLTVNGTLSATTYYGDGSNLTGVGGGPSLREVTGTTTFATANETVNCTSGTFVVNLPTAVGIKGTTYTLVNSGTGIITMKGSLGQTINGSTTIGLKRQYISRTVQSNGLNWIVI